MISVLSYAFFQRALIAGFLLALVAPLLGYYLVAKGYSHMANTLSHVSLLGVALALAFQFQAQIGAILIALLTIMVFIIFPQRSVARTAAIQDFFLTTGIALAVLIMSKVEGAQKDLFTYLFGSIITVTFLDIIFLTAFTLLVLGVFYYYRKDLYVILLDKNLAISEGIPVRKIHSFCLLATALFLSMGIQMVGVLLVAALVVGPILVSFSIARTARLSLVYALIVAQVSTLGGLLTSALVDVPSGPTIVAFIALFYTVLTFTSMVKKFV